MPKTILSISSLDDLNLEADAYALGYEKYTLFAAHYFSYEEIKSIKDKNIFILMNALIHEKEVEEAIKEVDKLISLGVGFIIQDIGLLKYLSTKVDKNKLLFFPYTYICNKEELSAYYDLLGVDINISNELTLEEIKTTLSSGHAVFNLFGYTPIYQSYRKILSLYQQEKRLDLPSEIYLKENTRNDKYPVIENKYGSVIFRSHPNSYLENYSYVKEADYLFIDSFKIEHSLLVKIMELTNKLIKEEIKEGDILKEYQEIGFTSFDDFKYKKTVVKK